MEPFSKETIERFVCFEMLEAGVLPAEDEPLYVDLRAGVMSAQQTSFEGAGQDDAPLHLDAIDSAGGREPFDLDFKTVASSTKK